MANIARLLSITARSTEIATKTVAKNADKVDDVVEVAKKADVLFLSVIAIILMILIK